MWQCIKNIYRLGIKELRGLARDNVMVCLILYCFTLQLYSIAASSTGSITDAAVAVVDEDHSQLSERMIDSLLPPQFARPFLISNSEIDEKMDSGEITFAIVIPHNFERNLHAASRVGIQLNVDATRMSQAFSGAGYIQQIFNNEVAAFAKGSDAFKPKAQLVPRNRFNPNLASSWFDVVMQLVNSITLLAIILTGSALIRERERGTLEHLLVMPVTPFQIMMSKIWSMAVVVLAASALAMFLVIRLALSIPFQGSYLLFFCGTALHLFAVTSLGIFLACVAESMPQLGMLLILVLMPMQMLSGGMTPRESMPQFVQNIMNFAPTTHFTAISQAIIFRGAGLEVVWKPFLYLFCITSVLFVCSLSRFRKSVA